ncbi:acyltransferase [Candidatus Marifrigoribacter sp. Uisw_064]|uniref:acyltransferase n=1 Tax=Candidatus Marifrigoribacter sp. Uisw_064 TaxID=3230970 RepID=UPI003D497CB1
MPYDKKSKVECGVYISNAKGLKIGNNCRINENVFIQEATIGNNVLIAPNVVIISVSHNHEKLDIPIVDQGDTTPNPPIIENGVWLARNVVIMPGITIGEGAIVGAGAIVTKDVKPFTIVGGVPAKFIKERKNE